jgi:glycosyltransferase involved in cell wall biosynthesis
MVPDQQTGRRVETLNKLKTNSRLRVLFVNDIGYQYGAGIAMLRQVQSLLLLGHEVAVFSYYQGQEESMIPVPPPGATGKWLGAKTFHLLDDNAASSVAIDQMIQEIDAVNPDAIIFGNVHSAPIPLSLLATLREAGYLVIAFMNDCYFATGRCAYPGQCNLLEVGCDASCPTWTEYPVLEPQFIHEAWQCKQELFSQSGYRIPVVANSEWTLGIARKAFKDAYWLETIHCGVDHTLFKPWNKVLARQLLGLPEDAFIVLSGAVNMREVRKGGKIIQQVVDSLKKEVHFVLFGAESDDLNGVVFSGLNRDYRKMPLLYGAADVFLGASLEEAFGQTLCEAAACATPVVAFNVGGIPEIAQPDYNALLSDDMLASELEQRILMLKANQALAKELGHNGRSLVERSFTLTHQGERWVRLIESLAEFEAAATVPSEG